MRAVASLAAARTAGAVVAEIDSHMARSPGDTFLEVGRIAAFVETSRPLPELPPAKTTAAARRMARHVASLAPDGATRRIGMGAITGAACLRGKTPSQRAAAPIAIADPRFRPRIREAAAGVRSVEAPSRLVA